jgi:zinc transporter ZupT
VSTHHPKAVQPEPVRGLGLTWVDRGPGYWMRRMLLTLLWLLIFAFATALSAAFAVIVLKHGNPVAFQATVITAAAAVIVASGYATVQSLQRAESGTSRRRRSWLLPVGAPLRPVANTLIGGLFIVLCAFIATGAGAVLVVFTCRRNYPGETTARRRLEEWRARHEPTPSHQAKGERHPHLPPATG